MNEITLRDDQLVGFERAVEHLRNGKPTDSLLLKSPTGSGKSYVAVAVHRTMNCDYGLCYTVAPTHEIAWGMYSKAFTPTDEKPERQRERAGFWTVKRLLNELRVGRVPLPHYLIFDESHHSTDDTHETVWALTGFKPRVGLTATDYRGTPKETAKLRKAWPKREELLSLRDACGRGVIARPNFITWPLLDDHQIDVVNGEFVVKQVDSHVKGKLPALVQRVAGFWDGCGHYDRPTMVTFSSVEQCRYALSEFRNAGLPAVVVVGETGTDFESDRGRAFERVVGREALLVQVAVVGEGVDLPIRRLIDCAPTMSPMKCMQRWGRVTRPTDVAPEIISCCHNFTRHSYLWHGVVPRAQVVQNQQAWGDSFKLTRRDMARALGLEGFGRFLPNRVPLADGTFGTLYALQSADGLQQYAVYLGPTDPDPRFFTRQFEYTGQTKTHPKGFQYDEKRGGKWTEIEGMPELTDCLSIKPDPITPKMLAWWRGERGMKGAARVGLDHEHVPNAREFQILPICCNTGVVLT